MKQRTDPRHQHRQDLVAGLYAYSFEATRERAGKAGELIPYLTQIDQIIERNAPEWPLNQINRVDLAVLRLAIFELTEKTEIPQKVVIDEAVELSKEYGSNASSKFINGVLASVLKELNKGKHDQSPNQQS